MTPEQILAAIRADTGPASFAREQLRPVAQRYHEMELDLRRWEARIRALENRLARIREWAR